MMKFYLQWEYKTKHNQQLRFTSDEVDIYHLLAYVEDIERTGRVKELRILDQDERQWSKKEIKRALSKLEDEPTRVRVYFDGGFDKQLYTAGLGVVVYYTMNEKQHRIRLNKKVTYIDNNNEAEYAALELAMKTVIYLGVEKQEIVVYGDSKNVIGEMSGEWVCYDEVGNSYGNRIEQMAKENKLTPTYTLLDRKENGEAHALASQALQDIFIESKKEVGNE
ncbi:MAG: reverse transcriptase-like protein [Bacillaceae bacterium]